MSLKHPSAGRGRHSSISLIQVEVIRGNVLDSMESLLEAVNDFGLSIELESSVAEGRVKAVLEQEDRAASYSSEVAGDVATLWQDPAVQSCVQRKTEFTVRTLLSSSKYTVS